MPIIEFIYDRDCPNVEGARAARGTDFSLKRAPTWQEWDRADPQAPDYVRAYGSPTILVDGKNIAGMPPGDASACRVYRNDKGNARGIPDTQLILAALREKPKSGKAAGGVRVLSALPAVGGALLPKLTCAACWPAYTALLGALGIEFVDYTPLPVTVTDHGRRAGGRALRPRLARKVTARLRPAGARRLGRRAILIGKFGFDSDVAAYGGVAALIGATVWNLWPRAATRAACPSCQTAPSATAPVNPGGPS